MTAGKKSAQANRSYTRAGVATSLGLFLLALLPRAYDLPRFVTADEAKWVYRSAQFLAALLNGDLAATSVNLTPAVTTTWLGSLGLALFYRLNQAAINAPFTDWLLSLPEFRADLPLLVASRWSMVIFTSLGVVIIYWLARRLFNPPLAFIGAVFIALDAHTIALSRVLGHDAPAAVFMTISLLLLLLAVKPAGKQWSREAEEISPLPPRPAALLPVPKWALLILSGAAAGLAFLSKAPALFLIPFAALLLGGSILSRALTLFEAVSRFILWGVAAYLTFILFWPAAWVDPLGRPWAVAENAFLSATDQEEADSEGYWRVPDLGPAYYLVNGAFKLSPLVTVGVILALAAPARATRLLFHVSRFTFHALHSPLFWLALFALLFTLFMTLGDKRSARYILPVFPPLAMIAAAGWLRLYQVVMGDDAQRTAHNRHYLSTFAYSALLFVTALIILLPYIPYYFTYYNPLLGGSLTAPYLVKIGWGEGLDRVGRFLQRELSDSRVGTAYASTVAPYFQGDLSGVTGDHLDFVVLYRKQVQSGEPSPAFIQYFEQLGPIFSVNLNGLHYADVYPGPAPQPALTPPDERDPLQPVSYRPATPYGRIGQPLEVDVLWQANEALPTTPATLALAPASVLDSQDYQIIDMNDPGLILAKAPGVLARRGDQLVVSRHRLILPKELARGPYALLLDGRPLGEVELRLFDPPANLGRVNGVVFDRQIALVGYGYQPAEAYIKVTLAWQAQKSRLPDYTVFAQFLDAETNHRLAGVDTRPVNGQWPTSRWVRNEVVVDDYTIDLPPDLGPGFYKVIVGLYQPQTGQRLRQPNGQDHWTLPFTLIREE